MKFSVIGISLLLVFCLIFSADGERVVAEKWISPSNDTTIVMKNGQSATLPCAVDVSDVGSGWPRWFQIKPFYRFVAAGTTVDKRECSNCEIVGDHSKGEYNLLIKDALAHTDEGQWECRMFGAIPNSLKVTLIILDENLTCSVEPVGPGYTVISDEKIALTCDLNRALPPPGELAWTVNGNEVIASANGTLRWETTFNETDKDNVYTCSYRYHTLVEPITCKHNITFNIQYCPKSLTISHENSGKVKEFDSFFAMCNANSNPAASYALYGPNGEVFSTGPNLTIDTVDRCYSGIYRCEAATVLYDNTQCNKSSEIYLDVQYPITVTTPQSVELLVGDDLTVTCQVSANPAEDSVQWFRGTKLVSNKTQLIIDDIRRQDAGTYNCNSTNTLYDGSVFSHSSATYINVECRSQWVKIPVNICSTKNGNVTLHCAVCGNELNPPGWSQRRPRDRDVSDGTVVDRDACPNCSITGDQTKGEYYLTITSLEEGDAGVWRCTQFKAVPGYREAIIAFPSTCTSVSVTVISGALAATGNIYDVYEDSDITVQCTPVGCHAPCINLAWCKDGSLVPASNNSHELNMTVRHNDDKVRIYCKVSNEETPKTIENYVELRVQRRLQWRTIPRDISTFGGRRVTLECALYGLESSLPGWSQREPIDREVSDGPVVDHRVCSKCSITGKQSEGEYFLTIDPFKAVDAGIWRCTQFMAEPNYYEARITLKCSCSEADIIVKSGANLKEDGVYRATEDDTVILMCSLLVCQGECENFAWYEDGELIPDSNSDELHIKAHRSHIGRKFSCSDSERVIPLKNRRHIELDVLFPPEKTMISKENNTCPVNLTCSCESNPPATYSWNGIDAAGTTIEISPPEDVQVNCTSSNDLGHDTSDTVRIPKCGISGGMKKYNLRSILGTITLSTVFLSLLSNFPL